MAKRANGEGNIRKRKDGLWEARYISGKDENGKIIRKSIYGRTQKEVARKLNAVTCDINTGVYIEPEKMTVSEWAKIWLAEYNKSVKQATLAQYDYQVRCHIKPGIGSLRLQKVTAPMLQKFMNERAEGTLSPKSCRNLHGVLHKLFDQAIRCGYIKNNPVGAVQIPRVEKKEMNILSDEYLKKFLEEIKGKPHEDLFYFAVFTGMRQGEVLGLTWDCIDFDKGLITVNKQLCRVREYGQEGRYEFGSCKNGKTRILAPAKNVFACLKRVKAEQSANKLKYGRAFQNDMNLVFTNELGQHLFPVPITACFKRRVTAIGRPEVRFHDLRHTFATISLEN